MLKKILGAAASLFGIAYAGNFMAIIPNEHTGSTYNSGGTAPLTPADPVEEPLVFVSTMTVGLHKPWSSGYHRGYNYSTTASRPTPLGALSPDVKDGYKMRALTTYTEPGYSNAVFEIDGDVTSTGRYIEAFEVEFVGFKTYTYKNQEKYLTPENTPAEPNFSEFRPDNDAAVGLELDGWFSSNNGQNIDVIITEITSE